jgi:hypothetical protein
LTTTINAAINDKDDKLFNSDDSDSLEDDNDDDNESVLSEIENEELYFQRKLIYQNRALFRKNFTL